MTRFLYSFYIDISIVFTKTVTVARQAACTSGKVIYTTVTPSPAHRHAFTLFPGHIAQPKQDSFCVSTSPLGDGKQGCWS